MQLLTAALIERFWSKIIRPADEAGCWLWGGSCNSQGYGHFTVGKRWLKAHRVRFELHYGPIPSGKVVMHLCDVRACCRPSHLIAATQQANIQDAVRKGRMSVGELNGQAKLTAKKVRKIRSLVEAGHPQKAVAVRFGIAPTEVSRIFRRVRWAHLR